MEQMSVVFHLMAGWSRSRSHCTLIVWSWERMTISSSISPLFFAICTSMALVTPSTSEVEKKMILMGHQISSCHALAVMSFRGLLHVTVLNLYISSYGYLFGTATYVYYLTFSHLNPISNPTPLPNTTLTIGATARNPNYRVCTLTIGAATHNPNYWGCCTQP